MMKILRRMFLLVLLISVFSIFTTSAHAHDANFDGYDDDDVSILANFLYQSSFDEGKTNMEVLGVSISPGSWSEQNVTWDNSSPKRIKTIDFNNTLVSGTMDLRGLNALQSVKINNTFITELNVNGLTALEEVVCNNSGISVLDIGGLTNAKTIICDNTGLSSLDVTGSPSLTTLTATNASLQSIKFITNNKIYILVVNGAGYLDVFIKESEKRITARAAEYFDNWTIARTVVSTDSVMNIADIPSQNVLKANFSRSETDGEDYAFTLNSSFEATITSYEGSGSDIEVPDTLYGYPVKTIGSRAFLNKGITSVTLPSGITTIKDYAFEGCSAMTQISIPDSVTSIDRTAFTSCTSLASFAVSSSNANYSSLKGVLYNKDITILKNYPIGHSGTSFTAPNSVTEIGMLAFSDCLLQSVTLPNVVNVQAGAFFKSGNLNTVSMPNATSIGMSAFQFCDSLISVSMPKAEVIENTAFAYGTALTSITLPATLDTLGSSAFLGCSNLSSVYFLGNAPEMGDDVFKDCADDLTIYYLSNKTGFSGSPWDTYTLEVSGTYQVTYNGNGNTGGSAPTDANSYSSGGSATVLGNTGSLVKTGYSFAGWNTASNGSGTNYSAGGSISISENVTLYARWTAASSYSVAYNGNGNTGGSAPTDANSYSSGGSATVLGNTGSLVKTGYSFAGWNTASNGGGTNYSAGGSISISENVTLYARWTAESSQVPSSDATPGTLLFSAATYTSYEGTSLGVTVIRTGGSDGEVAVSWSVSGATAVTDFSGGTSGTLTFADGEYSKTITLGIVNDSNVETSDILTFTISNPTRGAKLGSQTTATVKISDYIEDTSKLKNTVKSLTAVNKSIELNPGTSTEGRLLVVLSNKASYNPPPSAATWSTSNSKVATVSNGVITAVAFGKATITATLGSKSARFTVTIAPKQLTLIDSGDKAISSSSTLKKLFGHSEAITLKSTDFEGKVTDVTESAVWTSSNTKAVTVIKGVITTTQAAGQSVITATYGGKSLRFRVTTTLISLVSSLSSTDLKLKPGASTEAIKITATYADGSTEDVSADAQWKSSNTSLATVDKCIITAGANSGKTKITASYGGKTVNINVNTALKLSVGSDDIKLACGGASTVTLTATYSDGTTANVTSSAVWKSSDLKIAKFDSGVISAVDAGKAYITATYKGESLRIKVDSSIAALEASSSNVTITQGNTSEVSVSATNALGAKSDVTSDAVWTTSNAKIATVSGGKITAVAKGKAIITVIFKGKKSLITVEVK